MTPKPLVVVVGGGLAGLVAAYRLAVVAPHDVAVDVLVLEGEERVGGKLRTERVEGFVLEAGADGFVPAKGDVEALATELGIDSELVSPHPTAVRAYLRAGGRLERLLGGESSPVARPASLLRSPLVSPLAKARILAERLVPARSSEEDETVESFLTRRLGQRAYEQVYEPLLAGVHGAEPSTLSAAAVLPALVQQEARGGSLLQLGATGPAVAGPPRPTLLAFRGGMSTLPRALLCSLGASRVRTGAQVVAVRPGADADRRRARLEVETASGDRHPASAVILAAPAAASAALLERSPELSRSLASLPTAITAVVNLGYPATAVDRPLDAHGYINHRRDGRPVSGCTWSSAKFDGRAPARQVLLRGFVRGDHVPAAGPGRDEQLVGLFREELMDSLSIHAAPTWTRVHCWTVPVYSVGHPKRVAAVRASLDAVPGLEVAGASYDGVGLEAVIRSADRAARDVVDYLGTSA